MSWLFVNRSEIAAQFGLPSTLQSVDGVDCLTTDTGLAAVRSSVTAHDELTWVGASLSLLSELGIRDLGQFIRAEQGAYAVRIKDRWVYLTQFASGTPCDANNLFEVRSVGRVLAQLHRASPEVLAKHTPPPSRVADDWLIGARERASYWRLAAHRFRKGTRGEALRHLLRSAEESLTRAEKLGESLWGERVLSLARVSFGYFAYLRESHAVYLNEARLHVDLSVVNIGDLLLESGVGNEAGLHLLAAYQAVRPLSPIERDMLLAYLCYPHEWAEQLDELTRGNAAFDGEKTMATLKRKGEWIEWLEERFSTPRKERSAAPLSTDKCAMAPRPSEVTDIAEPGEPLVSSSLPSSPEPPLSRVLWRPFPRR